MAVSYFVFEFGGYPKRLPTRWTIDGLTAKQESSVLRPIAGNGDFQLHPGEPPELAFARAFNGVDFTLHPTELPAGGYYPRIARPFDEQSDDRITGFPMSAFDEPEIAGTSGQLISLVGRLNSICQVVEPVKPNLNAFGHAIRECLVIAAMEAESHWKAVLRANGSTGSSTKDYIKTLPAMKLDEYEIAFARFPDLDPIRPFAGWDVATPTKSLPFYDAYNAVKHDRETQFHRATLDQAVQAVASCAILATAQFGWRTVFERSRALEEFFLLTDTPKWGPGDRYASEENEWPATAINYKF